jgi:hypothetical protein
MLNEPTQFQIQSHDLNNMTDNFNQWHQQPTSDSHMISNQNYQMPAAATTLTTNQQTATSYLANADQLGMMYSHTQDNSSLLPQISPQVNVSGNNYMGQQTTQGGGVVVVQRGGISVVTPDSIPTSASTSDESDDLNDPNVSILFCLP